jgi:hypothetical protein
LADQSIGSRIEPADSDPGDVVEHLSRSAGAGRHMEEHIGGSRLTTKSARFVHQYADALVARPRQSQPIRLFAHASADLGERHLSVIEPRNRVQKSVRDPRREARHAPSVARH